MAPFPQDSDDDPEEMFAVNNDDQDDEYVIDDEHEVIVLDENDAPGIEEAVNDLDFDDIPEDEENGYIPDDSKMVFQKHDGSVFCAAISPKDKNVMVSGGEDDKGYIMNMTTGEVLFECNNHKDSVISCGFNADGKYVMTADMGGTIIVRSTEDGKTVWDFDCGDVEWCKWHTSANVIFAGTTEGDVYMWKIPIGDCKIYQTHGSKSTSSCLSSTGKELLTGYGDGSVKLWDLKNVNTIFNYKNDEDPVLSVAFQNSGGNLTVCGTQSGNVKLINGSTGKLFTTFAVLPPTLEDVEKETSIESLAFSSNGQYLATASLEGKLSIWDLSSERVRHECKHPEGVSHVLWLKKDVNVILTACLDGIIREWDSGNGSLIKELQGHRGHILDLVVSDDGNTLLTAGDDGTSRIFDL